MSTAIQDLAVGDRVVVDNRELVALYGVKGTITSLSDGLLDWLLGYEVMIEPDNGEVNGGFPMPFFCINAGSVHVIEADDESAGRFIVGDSVRCVGDLLKTVLGFEFTAVSDGEVGSVVGEYDPTSDSYAVEFPAVEMWGKDFLGEFTTDVPARQLEAVADSDISDTDNWAIQLTLTPRAVDYLQRATMAYDDPEPGDAATYDAIDSALDGALSELTNV